MEEIERLGSPDQVAAGDPPKETMHLFYLSTVNSKWAHSASCQCRGVRRTNRSPSLKYCEKSEAELALLKITDGLGPENPFNSLEDYG